MIIMMIVCDDYDDYQKCTLHCTTRQKGAEQTALMSNVRLCWGGVKQKGAGCMFAGSMPFRAG